ncbi:aromatic ring-hydroxylating dioxygenase subunit alpha [Spirillospora sp. NPDC048819]|uniref:aromatic ring-hydroxylating dioxygenase subunit alpha n=1 Tax=Spirillospora sp. NPDC048819 TaxID=3155268 RepID=UPI0033EE846B
MLKNFWYAVEFADAVTRAPKRVTCLGQDFVIYRKRDGGVVCLSDLCAHRGAALSRGKVVDDQIACPYHGWRYEPGGACTLIPANPEGRGIPKKARVDSYPVREEYGLIWAFLGDLPEDERPPIPHFPEHDDPKFARVDVNMIIEANYERTFENVVDAAHTPFVHGTRFGNPDKPQIPDYEITQDDWSAVADIMLSPPPARGLWKRLYKKEGPSELVVTNGWYLPNIVKLHVRLPFGDMILYDHNIPLSRDRTLVKIVGYRNFFTGRWADRDARRRIESILLQDKPVVESQRPELLPYDLPAELHLRSDALQVAYRRRRQQLMADGWWIGDEDMMSDPGPRKSAVVIASPARRENPELARAWMHKARGGETSGGEASTTASTGTASTGTADAETPDGAVKETSPGDTVTAAQATGEGEDK